MQAAAGNLKKVSLELGGKSPNVVFKDADLETAIPGAASAIFFNHGQCCCAGSRLYVEKSVFDKVVEGVAEAGKQIKIGPGWTRPPQMGPLVSERAAPARVRLPRVGPQGRRQGGDRRQSRRRARAISSQPTVLTDVKPSMKVVRRRRSSGRW